MEHFLKCIEYDEVPNITLDETAEIMRIIEICKSSTLN